MTRKHATMTDGEGICLAFQSEHGGFDCSEAAIDRVSGALICNDGTLEGLGEGVADAAIYPTAEIFAGARLLALDRAAEGYADGRDAHAIDAAAKSVAESVRRNCIEIGGAGASMIDFAGHPFAASQWIGENFKTSISEVDARRLMQDLTLVDIARLDRSRPLIEGMGAQAHEGILAFLDGMEELRASSVDVELFDRLMTDDFNVVRTLGRDRSRELGTVTIHGRDIEISCTLADGFCATARPQAGTILTFSSRRLGWHGFQSSPLSFGGSTVSIRHDMPSARLTRDFDLAALSAEAETAMRELGVSVPAALKYVKEECERVSARCDEIEAKVGAAVDAAKHVHMSDRVFPSGEKGAFTVLTQMDRIIARDAKGPAEIELKLREAQHALADAQKAAKEPFPKQTELDEAEQRLAVLEQERIEAEAQRQREQAQRAEAEAAAIEEGVEDEREAERKHERAAVADDEARERGRVAELRRQGLICEDSAAHAAATATACGIASGCPDDVAEAARCSAAASVREERDGGEKHKAGM